MMVEYNNFQSQEFEYFVFDNQTRFYLVTCKVIIWKNSNTEWNPWYIFARHSKNQKKKF